MAYVFRDGRFVIENKQQIAKAGKANAVLQLLRSFLDANEPQIVRFLMNTWQSQGRAITYKELREAILSGDIDPQWIADWQQDYARFVVQHLQPVWEKAIATAAAQIAVQFPGFSFDPFHEGVIEWVKQRGAAFVTNSTMTQIEGLRAVVQKAAVLQDMTVDGLARAVRPMVGLTVQQAQANLNYYTSLKAAGMSEKKAQEKAMKYAAKQHRYRGYNIARTELCFAYNQGSYVGIQQAQEAGLCGQMVKVWCTAYDERMCTACASLDGKAITMDSDFYTEIRNPAGTKVVRRINPKLTDPQTGKTPPAHPSCRCSVYYEPLEDHPELL